MTAFKGLKPKGEATFSVTLFERCNAAGSKNECSDNGDCVNGTCVCDSGFTGQGTIMQNFQATTDWGHESWL